MVAFPCSSRILQNASFSPRKLSALWCSRLSHKINTYNFFMFSSTVHHSIELFHLPALIHNSLFINKCMLHYYPRNVSSINMPIFRRKNFIHTESGIVALCKRLHSTPVESGLSPLSTSVLCSRLQRAKIPDAVWIKFFLLKMGMLMLETCRG